MNSRQRRKHKRKNRWVAYYVRGYKPTCHLPLAEWKFDISNISLKTAKCEVNYGEGEVEIFKSGEYFYAKGGMWVLENEVTGEIDTAYSLGCVKNYNIIREVL